MKGAGLTLDALCLGPRTDCFFFLGGAGFLVAEDVLAAIDGSGEE